MIKQKTKKQNHHRRKRKPEIKQQRIVHNKQLSKDLFYIHVKKLKVHKGFYTTSEILIKIFASSLKKHNKKKTNETIKNTNLEVNTVQMQNCFKTARFNDQVNAQRLQIMYDWPKNTSHIQRQREKN